MPLLTGAEPYRSGKNKTYTSAENGCKHIGNNVDLNYVDQYKVDGQVFRAGSGPERCDFLLLNEEKQTAYYIELKGTSIPKAIQQLNNSVSMLRSRHPKCDKIYYRIIYHAGSHETDSSATLRWKRSVGVNRVIIKSRQLEENI